MNNDLFKYVWAFILGVVFHYVLVKFWNYFPEINPLSELVYSCCSGTDWFLPMLYLHDACINTLLCFLPAIVIVKLNLPRLWLGVAVAVLPSFIYFYHPVLFVSSFYSTSIISSGVLPFLFGIPIAVLVLCGLGIGRKSKQKPQS